MTEQHEEHESFIKTPKQLIVAVVGSFAVFIGVCVMFSQLVTAGKKAPPNEEQSAELIQPVAKVEIAAGGGAAKGNKTGEEIVQGVCGACHTTGAAGAPKIGDSAAWAPRLSAGLDGLTKSAIAGKNAMPPRGGAADLSDVELARAIVYMANKSGASFKEPAAPAAAAPAAEAPASTAAAASAPAPAAEPSASAKADGKGVYDKVCTTCHATGLAGAPKFGDKAAWAPRISTGIDTLHKSALNGKNAMPAKGGNAALSDSEVQAAVNYMVSAAK